MRPMGRTFRVVLLGEAQHRDESIVHVEVDLHGRGRGVRDKDSRMLTERLAEVLVGCLGAHGSEVPV